MKKMKKIIPLLLCLTLAGCQSTSSQDSSTDTPLSVATQTPTSTETASESDPTKNQTVSAILSTDITQITGSYSKNALNPDLDKESAIPITLNKTSIKAGGNGVTINGSTATITSPGTYIVSGTLTDGRLIVNLTEDENIHIILNGATITCTNQSPLTILSAKNTYLTLADGTKNKITDGSKYTFENTDETEPDAAIFSKDDLVINGNGTLTVTASYNDGIKSKDDLKIISGTIKVTASGDAIVGKDSLSIKNGNFTIKAKKDGLKSSQTDSAEKGFIVIDNGTFNITSGNDGMQAVTLLCINNGTFQITTNKGSESVTFLDSKPNGGMKERPSSGTDIGSGSNPPPSDIKTSTSPDQGLTTVSVTPTPAATDSSTSTEVSAKGLKSDQNIGIFGGTFQINSADDSINSNQAILIQDGQLTLASGDDGIHSDTKLTVNNGSITITKCYEGLESQDIIINNGKITLTTADDGINASSSDTTAASLIINGGEISIDANGDGLDSNGTISMNGGDVKVIGPVNNGNGILDYDSTFTISGGTLFASGSSGMAQIPDSTSSQATIVSGFTNSILAGTKVTITNKKGDVIYSYTPEKDFSMIEFSSSDIIAGKSYTITAGDQSTTLNGGESKNLNTQGMGQGKRGGGFR